MSHVDDGELTAYADGAYPANDPEALRIGAHLSTCDNCRARLELAHALRDRAGEVLGYAAPLRVETPPFEKLEAQMATSARRPRRTIPLAWAASIIMALGLGWFGRGFWQNVPEMQEMAVREAPRPTAEPDVRLEDASVPAPAAPAVTPADAPTSEPAPAPGAGRTEAARSQVAANQARRERAQEAAVAEADMAADRMGFAPTGNAAGAAAARQAAEPSARLARENLTSTGMITAAEAERRGLPHIPELGPARVTANGDTTTIVQFLSDGRPITLIVTPEPTAGLNAISARVRDSTREAPPPAAPQEVAKMAVAQPVSIRVRGKLVSVSGAVPADSLRVLAEKIR